MKWGIPFSVNFIIWGIISFIRYIDEKIRRKSQKEKIIYISPKSHKKIAVCIAAKNEEKVIQKTISSIKKIISLKHCYVVSDASIDNTFSISKKNGCNIMNLKNTQGKAHALEKLIKKYNLLNRYEYILFVDADTQIDENYLINALPVFDNPKVACIAAYAKSQWENHRNLSLKYFYISYRARLYKLLQLFLMYGQAWFHTNVIYVVPGFASIYRTSVLKKLKINIKGLAIEDFNMAFQIHLKKLGLIAHYPNIFATAQDPSNFTDYCSQIERWNLGFYQTVRHYGIWGGAFWTSLLFLMLEILLSSLFFFFLPYIIIFLLLDYFSLKQDMLLTQISIFINEYYFLWSIILGVIIIDYIFTIFVAVADKRPIILIYGLGFIFLRIVDAVIFVMTIPRGLLFKSKGDWTSPERR